MLAFVSNQSKTVLIIKLDSEIARGCFRDVMSLTAELIRGTFFMETFRLLEKNIISKLLLLSLYICYLNACDVI